jgi:hypothetical protein
LFLRELLATHGVASTLQVGSVDAALETKLLERALLNAANAPAAAALAGDASVVAEAELLLHQLTTAAPAFSGALAASPLPVPIRFYCWIRADPPDGPRELDPLGAGGDATAARAYAEVPDLLRYTIGVSVRLDVEHDGRRRTSILTSAEFAADSLGLDPILLSVVPERLDLLDSLTVGADAAAVIRKIDTFFPALSFRDQHHADKGFNLRDEVVELSEVETLADGAPLGGRLGGLLGGGADPSRGAGRVEPPSAGAHLLELRVEYEIHSPDGVTETAQRQLVDPSRFSTADRAAVVAGLVQHRQLLVVPFAISPAYWARRTIDFFRRNRSAVEFLARADSTDVGGPPVLLTYPFQLLLLAVAEDAASLRLSGPGQRVVFRARPEVLVLRHGFSAAGAAVRRTDAIDIVGTGFEALSADGRERAARALMGIYSSIFEVLALRHPRAQSLGSVMRAARRQGIPTVTLTSADES